MAIHAAISRSGAFDWSPSGVACQNIAVVARRPRAHGAGAGADLAVDIFSSACVSSYTQEAPEDVTVGAGLTQAASGTTPAPNGTDPNGTGFADTSGLFGSDDASTSASFASHFGTGEPGTSSVFGSAAPSAPEASRAPPLLGSVAAGVTADGCVDLRWVHHAQTNRSLLVGGLTSGAIAVWDAELAAKSYVL